MLTTKIICCPFCKEPNRILPFMASVPCKSCEKSIDIRDPFIGDEVGEYRIEKKLGHGREGNVYLGISQKDHHFVAIKSLNPVFSATESWVKRFFFEADVIERLVHPNIVRGFGVIEKSQKFFLIQEFIEGLSLEDYFKQKGIFSWDQFAPIIKKICDALAYAHSRQIVHRDIKPSNIMLTLQNEPKLTDFGISKSLDYSAVEITDKGQTVGTPSFMAPEICTGAPFLPRTDIYSLGVTCYCLLTGKKPIDGKNTKEILVNQVLQEPVPAKEVASVSPEVSQWISKMMQKNPEKRYQSVEEVILEMPSANLSLNHL